MKRTFSGTVLKEEGGGGEGWRLEMISSISPRLFAESFDGTLEVIEREEYS